MRRPDFDELVGHDLAPEERERLRRVHDLLVQADAPPELSPELEKVPWPDESLQPLFRRRREKKAVTQRPLLIAAVLATAVLFGVMLGRASNPTTERAAPIDQVRVVRLQGTELDPDALATLRLGARDSDGNWPMVLQVQRLDDLGEGGYYDLYLTRDGEPTVLCGTFNSKGRGEVVVRFTAAYDLERFDENGWVVTRQPKGHHEHDQIVLRPES